MKTGVIWKRVGETPLQALRRFRTRTVLPVDVPLSYSGRLDPMAEGKILILIGDECKQEKAYRGMDKEYEFEILFGISTDTGDVLGMPTLQVNQPKITAQQIKSVLKQSLGTHSWPYPHYSSKPVHGKPLHIWAREGKIHQIELPKTVSRIDSLKLKSLRQIGAHELKTDILSKIRTLQEYNGGKPCSDFRQTQIEYAWENQLHHLQSDVFYIAQCVCVAGSGTYMRTLAEYIGKELGLYACAYSIKRMKIGVRRSIFGLHFWYPSW